MCSNITSHFNPKSKHDPASLLKAIYYGINVYQNYTGTQKCFDLNEESGQVDMDAWEYQVKFKYF